MARDDNVVVFGEDVGYFGGVFRCTEGLQRKYGKTRCFDAPINEFGIVGAAIGMAAYGLRPVVEIQFADYVYPGYDQIVSEAARLRYRSDGEFTAPIVVRMPCGGGIFGGQTHSQSPEALFTHVCGLKTVMPSNPHDAKGLLIAAIEDHDPVIFLEPKRLYNGPFDGHHDEPVDAVVEAPARRGARRPLRHAARQGRDPARGQGGDGARLRHDGPCRRGRGRRDRRRRRDHRPAHAAAARPRSDRGLGREDRPLRDRARGDADLRLRRRTCAQVQERCFYHLEAPIERVTGWDTPYPHAQEWDYFPGPARVGRALLEGDGGVSMGERSIKMPDVGEGVAEAELVEWQVKVGDLVREDQVVAAVMTDKATVEIPSPRRRHRLALGGEVGDVLAVGAELIRIEAPGLPDPPPPAAAARAAAAAEGAAGRRESPRRRRRSAVASRERRRRARRAVAGAAAARRAKNRSPRPPCACAPGRRASICAQCAAPGPRGASPMRTSTPFSRAGRRGGARRRAARRTMRSRRSRSSGLRRRIAENMAEATRAHRAFLLCRGSRRHRARRAARRAQRAAPTRERPKLTLLPFLMLAIVKAVADFPQINAHYDDDERGDPPLRRRSSRHRDADAVRADGARSCATPRRSASTTARARCSRVTEAARQGVATRDELVGLDDHAHLARRARRHRLDAGHQPAGSRDRRRQQDRGEAGLARRRLRSAQDDEPFVVVRSSRRRRL